MSDIVKIKAIAILSNKIDLCEQNMFCFMVVLFIKT